MCFHAMLASAARGDFVLSLAFVATNGTHIGFAGLTVDVGVMPVEVARPREGLVAHVAVRYVPA